MDAEQTKVTPENFLTKVAEALDLDMDVEEALRDRLQNAGTTITDLQGQLTAEQQKCAGLEKVAAKVPEDSGPVLDTNRLVQVADSLADAGLMSKQAADNAVKDPEVLLGFLEKAADQARRDGARMASVDAGDGAAVRTSGSRASDEHWAKVVSGLRSRIG